jgi:hypothetical protein
VGPGASSAAQGEGALAESAAPSGAESPAFIEDTVALRDSAQREAAQEREERLRTVRPPRRPRLTGRVGAAVALVAVVVGLGLALGLNQDSGGPAAVAKVAQRPTLPHPRPVPPRRAVTASQHPRKKATRPVTSHAAPRRPARQLRAKTADREEPAPQASPAPTAASPAPAPSPEPVAPVASQPTSTPVPPQKSEPSPTPASKEFGFER